ncbi:MAG TPA: hypothetical protein VK836_21800 [Streptosporangiaceae bacterium]|nr:hypothetical protein [Streptosporangiaceae bacterium]
MPDPSSGELSGHRSAVQVVMPRLGNNETVVPVKVDTGWLELAWAPVAGTHGTLSGRL